MDIRFVSLTAACASIVAACSSAPSEPPKAVASATPPAVPASAAEPAAPPPKPATPAVKPATPPPATPPSAPPKTAGTTPPPKVAAAPAAPKAPTAPKAPAKASPPPVAAAKPAPPVQTAQTEMAAAPKPQAAARPAPLDLKSLEQRLKDTGAIGVLTKLSLKNQVDDLIGRFRAYHSGVRPPTLPELRPAFELLLMKVLSLLQDKDPGLAHDIDTSREAIWGVLTDRSKLEQLS